MVPITGPVGAAAGGGGGGNFAAFDVPGWLWVILVASIVVMLVVDLLLVHRTAHVITMKEAAIESGVWISLGLAFGLVLFAWQGGQAAGEYYAGFLIEKSLSIDNVFVWAVIFSFFAVPREYQFRVLFWGIFGALVLRGVFIVAGVSLIERFEWVLYLFGAFLLYTAWKIAHHDENEQVDYDTNIAMRLVRRIVPTTTRYDGQRLFTKENGKRLATPLFTILVLIEATDVVFAVDSVPAILAVSREPFIVFAANAFAILGLRSLYFLLGGMQGKFRYLNIGLGVILAFVGVKMLLIGKPFEIHLPTYASLAFIATVIAVAVVGSLRADARDRRTGHLSPTHASVLNGQAVDDAAAVDPPRPGSTPIPAGAKGAGQRSKSR
ncbi:MAG TPA: TerC family protein [Acidimicrobiia bacterium]|nr:TerC family protein [Acidimicrobiia bacterium]